MFLVKSLDILRDEFPLDWEKKYLASSIDEADALVELTSKISTASREIFDNLNLSIISGEYLNDNSEESIDQVIEAISKVSLEDIEVGNSFHNQIALLLYTDFTSPIRVALRNYSGHLKRICRKYNDPNRNPLFEAVSYNETPLKNLEVKNQLQVFNYNIQLSEIDHNLIVKQAQVQDLLLIFYTLKRIAGVRSDDAINTILYQKCGFLIQKALKQYNKDTRSYYYAVDSEVVSLNEREFDAPLFSFYQDSLRQYYSSRDDDDYDSGLKESAHEINRAINNENSPIPFQNYLFHIKYFKENDYNSLNKLERSFELFKRQMNESSARFDRWAYSVSINYLHNNILSFRLKNEIIDLDNFKKYFHEVIDLQNETAVKNYFPYLKLLRFLVDKGSENISYGRQTIDHSFLDQLFGIEKRLYISFAWCKEHNFLPYQLPIKECTQNVEISDNKFVSVFIASAFILPINIQKVQKEIEDLSRDLYGLKTKVELHKTILHEREKIEIIKNKVEKSDRRQIEILSVFAAIVMFVSSNIQIFSKAKSIVDALRFMLVFSYVLVLFVVVIWMITRENGFKWRTISPIHWIFIGLLVISTIVSLWLIYPC